MTEITITNEYGSVTIKDGRADLTIFELGELLEQLLLAKGYHPDSVNELFGYNEIGFEEEDSFDPKKET